MRYEALSVSNFVEALLRAVLILSDRSEQFTGEIWIFSCTEGDAGRRRARCRITPEPCGLPPSGEHIEIVYPEPPAQER